MEKAAHQQVAMGGLLIFPRFLGSSATCHFLDNGSSALCPWNLFQVNLFGNRLFKYNAPTEDIK